MSNFIYINCLNQEVTCQTLTGDNFEQVIKTHLSQEYELTQEEVEEAFKDYKLTDPHTMTVWHAEGHHTYYQVQ